MTSSACGDSTRPSCGPSRRTIVGRATSTTTSGPSRSAATLDVASVSSIRSTPRAETYAGRLIAMGGAEKEVRVSGSESPRRIYVRTAGAAYLLIMILALSVVTVAETALIVPGDDAATARNILANDGLFRIGIAGIVTMYATVVVLSAALFIVLEPVDRGLALVGMVLRLAEAVLGASTVLLSFGVLAVLQSDALMGFDSAQLQALAGALLEVRSAGLDIVLVLVGLGGTVFCYLFFKSKYVPRWLAGWGIFTYVSMLLLGFLSMLWPSHPVVIANILFGAGGAFEVVFGCWLLVKGVDD